MRRLIPLALRIELVRLKRMPTWVAERGLVARRKVSASERESFGFLLDHHNSPLRRDDGGEVNAELQAGKEANVARAVSLIDGICIEPFEIFSYHHAVGRPSRARGFRDGLELREGRPSRGVGGGCCQVSNMLCLLALRSGLKLVERHRHALDLFPDHQRTVPFGCGATVFYNTADLRIQNPLAQPVIVDLRVVDGELTGALRTQGDPGVRVEVYEVDHCYSREAGHWYRQNRIRRRFTDARGRVVLDQEELRNRGRVMYDIDEAA